MIACSAIDACLSIPMTVWSMCEIRTRMPLPIHPFKHKISHPYTSDKKNKKTKNSCISLLLLFLSLFLLYLFYLLPFTNSPSYLSFIFFLYFLIIVYFEIMSRSIKIQEKVRDVWYLFLWRLLLKAAHAILWIKKSHMALDMTKKSLG